MFRGRAFIGRFYAALFFGGIPQATPAGTWVVQPRSAEVWTVQT